MKLSTILCAIGILIVVHLSFLVVAEPSNQRRSLSDDIRNGINIAGKLFGVDSPTNIAAISNIAELVTRAFSNNGPSNNNNNNNNNNQGKPIKWHDRSSIERHHTNIDGLETFDKAPQTASQENHIDDTVIVGSSISTGPTTTNSIDQGFLGRILRVLGMDTNKIGALAVNGIVFIAQMIGQSLMTTFGRFAGKMRTQQSGAETLNNYQEQMYRSEPSASSSIVENAFEWIFEQSNKNPLLAKYMTAMLDKDLPENIVKLFDENNEKLDGMGATNVDCVKLLICKSAPIIWGMQEAVSKQMNDSGDENAENYEKEDNHAEDDDRVNAFFKYLPDVKVFQSHGDGCERRYTSCKIF